MTPFTMWRRRAAIAVAARVAAVQRFNLLLVVLEAGTNTVVAASLDGGVLVDATLSPELLCALATCDSMNPLRSGAIVIEGERILRAGVPAPMPHSADELTRLVAATSGGVVVCVSEVDGSIAVASRTSVRRDVAADGVLDALCSFA